MLNSSRSLSSVAATSASSAAASCELDDIPISTKTIICKTNWKINLTELFNMLPVVQYTPLQKKRGRRPKAAVEPTRQMLNDGDIITLKLKDAIRGVDLKERKKSKGVFRNSLNIVMQTQSKFINIKVCKNGHFQITGAKSDDNAQECVEYLKLYVDRHVEAHPEWRNKILGTVCNETPRAIFIGAMTNVNVNLGFPICRERLDRYMNEHTEFLSLLEVSFGYSGVNCKIPLKTIDNLMLRQIVFEDGKWNRHEVSYADYIKSLTPQERDREESKTRFTSFLVFGSGNTIVSSMSKDCMKPAFNQFIKIINECRPEIEDTNAQTATCSADS